MSCTPTILDLEVGNPNPIYADGVKDEDNEYVDDAVIVAVLRDSAGEEVTVLDTDDVTDITGATWPLTLDYIAGSDGRYRGTIPAGAQLTAGDEYTLFIDSNDDSLHIEAACVALTRTA